MTRTTCLALVLLASACSSSSSSPPDGGTATRGAGDGPVAASGCDHAAALCAKLDQCAPFFLAAAYGDVPRCTDRLTKVCTEQAGANGSGMTYDAIIACEATLTNATCADVFSNNIPGCSFRGTLPDGSRCGDNSQCAGGFCATGGELCGVCASKKGAGEACASGANEECQAGLVCSSGQICAAPVLAGAVCDDKTQPCLIGSFCTTANTCASTVAAGKDCPGAFINFTDGTVCLGKTGQAGQIGTAATGEPCGLAPGEGLPATLCAPGSVTACLSTGASLLGVPIQGICKALRDDTFTCLASSDCQAGAQCIAGTCQIPSGRYCP
jgi:hypothetical protein